MTLRTWLSISSTRSAARLARPLAATLLLGGLLLGLSVVDGTAQVAHAQKSGGGKTPPPAPTPVLPPARYMLTWLAPVPMSFGGPQVAVFPRDINQSGDLAGFTYDTRSAFAYSSTQGTTINLNLLVNAEWLDENGAPAGRWWANSAHGINDAGEIVGGATNVDYPTLSTRGFILEGAFGPAPQFSLLPVAGAGNQEGWRINNKGEAVGLSVGLGIIRYKPTFTIGWPHYTAVLAIADSSVDGIMDINDDGVIVARVSTTYKVGSYRQFASGSTSYFAGPQFWSISNGLSSTPAVPAMTSGSRDKAGTLAGGAFRLPVTTNVAQLIFSGNGGNYARAINDYGDTVFEASGRGFLYTDATIPGTSTKYGTSGNGILPLDHLVVNLDADWFANTYMIRFDGIRNRDSTGLGQICGFAYGPKRGFLLTPFVPAP
jgi:hypothetical protein